MVVDKEEKVEPVNPELEAVIEKVMEEMGLKIK